PETQVPVDRSLVEEAARWAQWADDLTRFVAPVDVRDLATIVRDLAALADGDQSKPEVVEDEATEIACAWSEYRKDYGVSETATTAAYKAFKAGWKAAREGDQSGVSR